MTPLDSMVAERLAAQPRIGVEELVETARRHDPLREVSSLRAEVERSVARAQGLGQLSDVLDDADVTEVMVVGNGSVWTESGTGLERTDLHLTRDDVDVLIERILEPLGLRVDPLSPMVDARLADGSRVNIVVSPVAVDGPSITIRRFSAATLPLSAFGPPDMVDVLHQVIAGHASVLVTGGTGAGKTTLLNAIAATTDPCARIVTIEDTAELRLPGEHVVRLEARPTSREGVGEVTIRQLVRNSLRMRPDRIVVGEVRGAEAFDLLLALNTGHRGSLATCHANGPLDGLRRLETLASMGSPDLPLEAIRRQMLAAIDVVVHVERSESGRRVRSVDAVASEHLATESLWP